MTARILQDDAHDDFNDPGYRDTARGARERSDRERRRGLTPDPKPAVRVNVPTERPMRDIGQDADLQPPRRSGSDATAPEGSIDDFRKRYNPGEMISSPRNPNRPVRAGQSRDVRKDRSKISNRDLETVSPLRWILAGAALFILVLIVFLVVRVNNLSGYSSQVEELQAQLAQAELREIGLRDDVDRYQERYQAAQNALDELIAGNGNGGNGGGRNGPYELPRWHTVQEGEFLDAIARRYFPYEYLADARRHIQDVNEIENPNHIRPGQQIHITSMHQPATTPETDDTSETTETDDYD